MTVRPSMLIRNCRRARAVVAVLALSTPVVADVLWLDNGKKLEGTIEEYTDVVEIRERNGPGLYGVASAKVVRVEYGVWLSDVDQSTNPVMYANGEQATGSDVEVLYEPQGSGVTADLMTSELAERAQQVPHVIVVIIGLGLVVWLLISLIATIVLLVDAFKHNVLWGVLCFIFNPLLWIHLFVNYKGRKFIMFLLLISPLLWIGLSLLAVYPYLR